MKDSLRREIERFALIHGVVERKDSVTFYVQPIDLEGLSDLLQDLSADYDLKVRFDHGFYVLEFRRHVERVWINVVLFVATVISTTLVGAGMFGNFDLVGGLTYSMAIMFVLGFHEMGHYVFARRWGMKTTLPYFIPFPSLIGTLGAVIRHRGRIPNRKALFDVGVSGPIFGILASVIVTYVGLKMKFEGSEVGYTIVLGTPPLFDLIAKVAGFNGYYIHPVAFAGWVGMFVTFLNIIPVGQLDGGHVLRAMVGEKAEIFSKVIPFILILMGLVYSDIWLFWGLITMFFGFQRHPKPVLDEPIDLKRLFLGILTFIIGFLCFTPQPLKVKG